MYTLSEIGMSKKYIKHNFSKIRRPLLARGHQAARHFCNHLSVFLSIFSMINQLLMVFAGLQVSNLWVLVSTVPPWTNQKPSNDHILLFWGAKRHPRNSLKLQGISNTNKNQQTGVPRPPKVSKMRSKQGPEIIKFMKNSKK